MSTCCFLLCNQKRSSSRIRYMFVTILRISLKWKHLWISFEFNIHSANLDFDICSWKYPIWPNITLNFCLSSSLNHLKWVWSIFFILAITSDKVSSKFCGQKSTQRRLWWNFVFEAYMACGGSTKEPSKRLLWPRAPQLDVTLDSLAHEETAFTASSSSTFIGFPTSRSKWGREPV